MNYSIVIALVGALINIMLSVMVPCVFKKSDNSIVNDMKEVYKTNRQLIFSSSIIIGITIYLALEFTPHLKEVYDNIVNSSDSSESWEETLFPSQRMNSTPVIFTSNFPPQLRNLIKLM